jgi:hypothetical protein
VIPWKVASHTSLGKLFTVSLGSQTYSSHASLIIQKESAARHLIYFHTVSFHNWHLPNQWFFPCLATTWVNTNPRESKAPEKHMLNYPELAKQYLISFQKIGSFFRHTFSKGAAPKYANTCFLWIWQYQNERALSISGSVRGCERRKGTCSKI